MTEVTARQYIERGLADDPNPFDERIAHLAINHDLLVGNAVRCGSTVRATPDIATFKNGWWDLNTNLQEMKKWMELRR